jgi:hypothetical protein
MRQTAIDWLEQKLNNEEIIIYHKLFNYWIKQAKEMEREQIVDAYFKGSQSENAKDKNPEFFYTINYKPFYPEK